MTEAEHRQLDWERRHFVICCMLSLSVVVPLLLIIFQGVK